MSLFPAYIDDTSASATTADGKSKRVIIIA